MKHFKKLYYKLINLVSFNLIHKQNIIISDSNKIFLELLDDYTDLELKLDDHRDLNKDLQEQINLLEHIIRAKEKIVNDLKSNDYGDRCDHVNNWLMRHIQKAGDN